MATTPTSNPIPSEALQDLKFNAGKIDEFATSQGWTYTDRFGVKRYTIEGMNHLSQLAISAYGYITLDSFQAGASITLPNQALRDTSTGEYYRWDGDLPKTVASGSTPISAGGIGSGKWLSVGDAVLRSDVNNLSYQSNLRMIEVAYNLPSNSLSPWLAGSASNAGNFWLYENDVYMGVGTLPAAPAAPFYLVGATKQSLSGEGHQTSPINNSSLAVAMQQQRTPRFLKKLSAYGYGVDGQQSSFTIVGMGSSVGNGATLPSPSTQAPVMKFGEYFKKYFDPAGSYPISVVNRSVDGSVITAGCDTHWPALIADGVKPDAVLLCYGMNDFFTASFNAGQTVTYFKWKMKQLIQKIQDYGADAILVTSPHPHSVRSDWNMPSGIAQSWPVAAAAPVNPETQLKPPVSQSIVSADYLHNGVNNPASARFLRGNDFIRQIAEETGSPLIDLEKYWFEAVQKYGENALFDGTQYNHPNLLGHQESYWKALEMFCDSMKKNTSSVSARQTFARVGISPADLNGQTQENTSSRLQVAGDPADTLLRLVRAKDQREIFKATASGVISQSYYLYEDIGTSPTKAETTTVTGRSVLSLGATQTFAIPANSVGKLIVRGASGSAAGVDAKDVLFASTSTVLSQTTASSIKTTDAALNVIPISVSGMNLVVTSGVASLQVSWELTITSIN